MNKNFPNATAALNDARKYGEVTGTLDAVGGDVKMDVHDNKISSATDTRFYGYHIGDRPLLGQVGQGTKSGPEIAEDAAGEAQQSYISGRQTAYEALRSR